MINSQLLDYIRQRLAGGVSKEDIVKALLANNWSMQDVNEAFSILEKTLPAPVVHALVSSAPAPTIPVDSVNTIWTKGIPRTNKIFMVLSLILVFGLDLFVIIWSPDLAFFWYIMLGVLAVFAVFFRLENFVFSRKFANTTSSLDKWIFMIIGIRNCIFLLNFVPFIQLLGLALLGGFPTIILGLFGGRGGFGVDLGGVGTIVIVPVLFVLYIILIIKRYSLIKNQ